MPDNITEDKKREWLEWLVENKDFNPEVLKDNPIKDLGFDMYLFELIELLEEAHSKGWNDAMR